MKIKKIAQILNAEILAGEASLEKEVSEFAASDLLSDVLALNKDHFLLLTALTSQQVLRTAEITGAIGVVIVNGKSPDQEAIGLARSHGISLLMTSEAMFEACQLIVKALDGRK